MLGLGVSPFIPQYAVNLYQVEVLNFCLSYNILLKQRMAMLMSSTLRSLR